MRRGLKWVPPVVLLATVVEIAVFVFLGRWLGFGAVILLILVASLAGMLLLRREGIRAWQGFRDTARAGQPPGRQVTDGLVGLAAGLLLTVPGLLTGFAGLLLTLPPVRRWARRRVQATAELRVSAMVAGDFFGPHRVRVRRGQSRPSEPDSDLGPAIEGEIV
jgi:UPF0716 protein FxsA